jgi:ribonuclease HI
LKKVELFCDGACIGNPGPGGWGTLLRFGDTEKELGGGEAHTTNNRMEMTALLAGLKALKEPCAIVVTSDSQYVVHAVQKGWLKAWQRSGWVRGPKKEPVRNADLWKEIAAQLQKHQVEMIWVRGHNGHTENERCDKIAAAHALAQKKHS